ncbi:hypothetical protein K0504_09770 [Neiella marina]|uniref:YbjN domain-containing protein n=1 Tax=Neiella holothuriorum TaxID=2870530 RepID=A0ABS7EGJ5_9GAMM|nr:hypothetical protein [Neiella holothuriorum]MBW8191324.1 hypothetical protein [Neiella holothuriorum]
MANTDDADDFGSMQLTDSLESLTPAGLQAVLCEHVFGEHAQWGEAFKNGRNQLMLSAGPFEGHVVAMDGDWGEQEPSSAFAFSFTHEYSASPQLELLNELNRNNLQIKVYFDQSSNSLICEKYFILSAQTSVDSFISGLRGLLAKVVEINRTLSESSSSFSH